MQSTCELHVASFVLSSMLILYDFGDLTGPQLVQTTDVSTLVGTGWDDRASSIQVNGGCQWILYEHPWNLHSNGISFVVGPGPRTYLNGTFGIPDNLLSSIRCLPTSGTQAIMLFVHWKYFGDMLVVNSSYANLARANFDNTISSFIISGGIWQLYSDFDYQGQSVTHGVGLYPLVSFLDPISNDALSSVRLVGGKRNMITCTTALQWDSLCMHALKGFLSFRKLHLPFELDHR